MSYDKEKQREYARVWYQRNKKSVLSKARAYALANREKTNAASRDWKRRNSTTIKEKRLRLRDEFPVIALWENARVRAKKRGLEFTISPEDIVIPDLCPVLGMPIDRRRAGKGGRRDSASLDRIDSNKGYVPGNVQVISWRANSLKKDATVAEIAALHSHMIKVGCP